jgi:tRNA (guanine-N7-)-methyltransferase
MQSGHFIPTDYFRELRKDEIFPESSRPLEVDLGCGDGSFLLAMAHAHPERDFLGVERMIGRYEKVARLISHSGLTNVKVMRLESSYTVAWLLPSRSVSRLHLLCPDPWPKKAHAPRRLVCQPEFHRGLTRVLEPGGEFLLKTDDSVYYADAMQHFEQLPAFNRAEWPADAFFYPQTDFERHWLKLDRSMHRARWVTTAGS